MNRDRVLGYAVEFVCFQAGSQYGQSGNTPAAPEELTEPQADAIRRAAMAGRRAGLARRDKDEARAQFEREYHQKARGLAKLAGLTAGLIDECYDAGYRSI